MTSRALFLHQLRHDLRAWRWPLGFYGGLLLLSIPSFWWRLHYVHSNRGSTWSPAVIDLAPGLAMLLLALALAGLLADVAPHDPEGFGHTRPVRSGMVLASRLLIYLACFILPWMLQQALLCHLGVGIIPWADLWLRLFTGVLPFAVCLAFAVIIGSTTRQKAIAVFVTLLLLFMGQIRTGFTGDSIFSLAPQRALYLLNMPMTFFAHYSWTYTIPQPGKIIGYQLLLLLLGTLMALAAWLWRKRVLPAGLFCGAIVLGGIPAKNSVQDNVSYLTATREKTLGLDKTTVQITRPRMSRYASKGAPWSLSFRPVIGSLPATDAAMAGLMNATLTLNTGATKPLQGTSFEIYRRRPSEHLFCAAQRLTPVFRRTLLGGDTDNLGLSKKESADEAYLDHVMKTAEMATFLPEEETVMTAAQITQTQASFQGTLALPITEYRIIARGPFRTGFFCRTRDGVDVHVAMIIPKFTTVRTSAGAVQQWSGLEIRLWYSSLDFAHRDLRWWQYDDLGGTLMILLYHPERHGILADMESGYAGSHLAGTPLRIETLYKGIDLDESRVGTVDEHWLEGAELILVDSRYLGTLRREVHVETLKGTVEQ